MTIKLNLWDIMEKKRITGLKLSKLSWISPEHISKMKYWTTESIKLWTIEKLLNSLDIELNELLTYKKE